VGVAAVARVAVLHACCHPQLVASLGPVHPPDVTSSAQQPPAPVLLLMTLADHFFDGPSCS
jgi:hypothetical protein